jgi:hypothetical protein
MNGVNAETFWTEMDNSDYQHFAPKLLNKNFSTFSDAL